MKNSLDTELTFKCVCGQSFSTHKKLLEHKKWLCVYESIENQ